MPVREPRRNEVGPLPPGSEQAFDRLLNGSGSIMIIAGGERAARTAFLDAIETVADTEGIETAFLRSYPHDRQIPYGTLYPWLAGLHHPKEDQNAKATTGPSGYPMPVAALLASLHEGSAKRGRRRARQPLLVSTDTALPASEVRAELLDLVEGRTKQAAVVITIEDGEFLDMPTREWFGFVSPHITELPIFIVVSLPGDDTLISDWQKSLANSSVTWFRLRSSPINRDGISKRLGTFSEQTLNALAAVAVAGPDASRAMLLEVLGITESELTRSLYPAVQAGLIVIEGDNYFLLEPAVGPNLGGLVKETTLRALHRAVAGALHKREPRPHGGPLFREAAHWAEAREVNLGIPALTAASEEAESWGSLELAEYWVRRAVRLCEIDPTERARELEEMAYARLGAVCRNNLDYLGTNKAYQRALEVFRERGAKGYGWVRYVCGIISSEGLLGKDPRERIEAALSEVRGRDSDMEAELLRAMTVYFIDHGQPEQAKATGERSIELAAKGNDIALKVGTRMTTAYAYIVNSGNPESRKERLQYHLLKALEQRKDLEGTPHENMLVQVNNLLMLMEYSLDNFQEAVNYGEDAVTEARRRGNRATLVMAMGNLAELCLLVKDLERAKTLAEEMRRISDRLSLPKSDADSLQLLLVEGLIAIEEKRIDDARESLESLVEISEKTDYRHYAAQGITLLANLEARSGNRGAAAEYVHRLESGGLKKALIGYHQRLLSEVEELLSKGKE